MGSILGQEPILHRVVWKYVLYVFCNRLSQLTSWTTDKPTNQILNHNLCKSNLPLHHVFSGNRVAGASPPHIRRVVKDGELWLVAADSHWMCELLFICWQMSALAHQPATCVYCFIKSAAVKYSHLLAGSLGRLTAAKTLGAALMCVKRCVL